MKKKNFPTFEEFHGNIKKRAEFLRQSRRDRRAEAENDVEIPEEVMREIEEENENEK
jgi:hypothetical protein